MSLIKSSNMLFWAHYENFIAKESRYGAEEYSSQNYMH